MNTDFKPTISHPLYIIRKNIYQRILKHSDQMRGKMMDFGCGAKPYKPLFKKIDEYIGVDYEGQGHSHKNEQIDVFYDGVTIPFRDNTFDCILSSEVFEHIFNLETIIKELNRVLKPGGKILITTPFAFNEHEIPNDFARYTSFGLKDLLQRNGFNVLSIEKTTHFRESLLQLKIVYWHVHILPRLRPFAGAFSRLFCFFANTVGLALANVFPKKYDYYLNLVVVAEKKGD